MPGANIDFSDGARGYLLPVGPVYGAVSGLRLGSSGLKFAAVRLIVRDHGERLLDTLVMADRVDEAIASLPDPVRHQVQRQFDAIQKPVSPLNIPGISRPIAYTKPVIMGVLNVTPDSFSDGGDHVDVDAAVRRARQMRAEGADIIDIGGESTRPGAKPVWEGEELSRVIPVISALRDEGIPLSIDTRRSEVMKQAVASGAHIINDVSALTFEQESLGVAAETGAPVILMHSQGLPETMQENPTYSDALLDVFDYLEACRDAATGAGIPQERIVLDPGLGFGKRVLVDNLSLINGIAMLFGLGCPVLIGASRKRFIGAITGIEDAKERVAGSVAAALAARAVGVQVFRVHDVGETVQAMKVAQALSDASMMDVFGLPR